MLNVDQEMRVNYFSTAIEQEALRKIDVRDDNFESDEKLMHGFREKLQKDMKNHDI